MTDGLPSQPVDIPEPNFVAPVIPNKPSSLLWPILLGVFVVILVSGLICLAYLKIQLTSSPAPSATPIPTVAPSKEPSLSPSPSPSISPAPSRRPLSSPTPTPTPRPTLDIRFGNPSASVKQTLDEGTGDGRVVNREYTSIQAGQFDEISAAWSPRVTVCYHLVSNEKLSGKDIKLSLSLDDKIAVEDNLGGYDYLEPGRIYDWCHDVTTNIGKHTARLLLNGDKSLKESNYVNDLARLEWENLADNVAPNYTITAPTKDGAKTCLSLAYLTDNVTKTSDLKIEEKYDTSSWATTTATTYCATGTSGSEHTYSVKVTDARGNANEQTKTFVLY